MPCSLSVPFPKSGPFPRPALPGVFSTTGLSATLPARTGPHGFPVGVHPPPSGLPVLPRFPSSAHAGASTPAEADRCVCRLLPGPPSAFPLLQEGRLPRLSFEACAAFTHIPARAVAEPPKAALLHQSASVYIVTSVNRSGCCQPKRQLLSGFRTRKENAPFHGARRVGGWRASFRVRWLVRRFRSGPQSGSLGRVSSPPLIKPDVRISRIRLSDGIMPSHAAQSGVSEHCVALIDSRQ